MTTITFAAARAFRRGRVTVVTVSSNIKIPILATGRVIGSSPSAPAITNKWFRRDRRRGVDITMVCLITFQKLDFAEHIDGEVLILDEGLKLAAANHYVWPQ